MTTADSPESAATTRRRRTQRVGVVLVVLVALVVGYLAARQAVVPPPGLAAAAEDAGFRQCAEEAGVDLSEADELGLDAEYERWAQTGALACAVRTLDDEELATALERPFEPERSALERVLAGRGPDASQTAAGQGVMLRRLGEDEAARGGRATAVGAVQRVLDHRPSGQPERPALATEATFGILSAEGPVPGFEEYAANQAGSGFDDDDLVVLFRRDALGRTPAAFREDFEALEAQLVEIEARQRG